MSAHEPEPTRDELMAMAFVDGELDGEALGEFRERLASSPELARKVSQFESLQVLARSCAPPEPMDHEWSRIALDPLSQMGHGLGFGLLLAGGLVLLAWSAWALVTSELELGFKLALGGLLLGAACLFLITLRNRLRTIPYDPYTEVKR